MRVLLLHREDRLTLPSMDKWDLIVDLGNSPVSVYETWQQQTGCPIVRLSSYARGFEDIYALKRESNLAHGLVVDKFGIDWWDVLLPMLYSNLNRCWMLLRLAKDLGNSVQLFCSRPDPHASALQEFLGVECSPLPGTSSALARKVRHYREVFSHLD